MTPPTNELPPLDKVLPPPDQVFQAFTTALITGPIKALLQVPLTTISEVLDTTVKNFIKEVRPPPQ